MMKQLYENKLPNSDITSLINANHAAGVSDDRLKMLQNLQKKSKYLNVVTVFGFTMRYAFK